MCVSIWMEIGMKTESPFLLFFAFKGCLPDFPSPSLSVPYPPSRDEQYIPQVIINYMTKTKKSLSPRTTCSSNYYCHGGIVFAVVQPEPSTLQFMAIVPCYVVCQDWVIVCLFRECFFFSEDLYGWSFSLCLCFRLISRIFFLAFTGKLVLSGKYR